MRNNELTQEQVEGKSRTAATPDYKHPLEWKVQDYEHFNDRRN